MTLKTYDRLVLLNVLPAQGDILTLRVVRDLQAALSFTEEESAALQFEQVDGAVRWKTEADEEKDIPIGDAARAVIRERLRELNDQKQLTLEHLPLYERFVES